MTRVSPKTVLIVEDDSDIAELIRLYLEHDGFCCRHAKTGGEAMTFFETAAPDLILLDVLLPDVNGNALCQQFRKVSRSPILFISGEKTSQDIITGLASGGDDYISKPFDPAVLLARVHAHLRRYQASPGPNPQVSQVPRGDASQQEKLGHLIVDHRRMEAYVDNEPLILSTKERQLLFLLATHRGQVMSVEQLYERVWGLDSDSDTRTVFVHIRSLRMKIERNPSKPTLLVTVRGFGYRLG